MAQLPVIAEAPTKPCLPPLLNSLLNSSTRTVWRDDEPVRVFDPGWAVPAIGGAERREAVMAIAALDAYLAPAPAPWTAARITALLGHWYVADFPAAVLKAIVGDWVTALAIYPGWAIRQACANYLAGQERKPPVAAIVRLCDRAVAVASTERLALHRLIDPREQARARRRQEHEVEVPRPTEEEIAEVAAKLRLAGIIGDPPAGPVRADRVWTAEQMAAGRRELGLAP